LPPVFPSASAGERRPVARRLRSFGVLRVARSRAVRSWQRADRLIAGGFARAERVLHRAAGRHAPPRFAPGELGGVLVVVAHPDDDLLFLSPDILADVRAGTPVTTVCVTSGDAGRGRRYLRRRERGLAAAYARMAGVADDWSVHRVTVGGYACLYRQLSAAPWIGLIFLRLPDGLADGRGTLRSGQTSLEGLLLGRTRSLSTVDRPAEKYTRDDLESMLSRIMHITGPRLIRTLDWDGVPGDGDHSDHRAVARLVRSARDRVVPAARLLGFAGYPVQDRPPNIPPAQLAEKVAVLTAYAEFDERTWHPRTCGDGRPEAAWLMRQYVLHDLPGRGDGDAG
jgi:LmbE family N-acetylglucosaminyl deacetylase